MILGIDPTVDFAFRRLFELPKYVPPEDNRPITDPIEQWAYYLRRASESSPETLSRRLGNPVFAEAIGVLEMIARSPRERELYEARLKIQRDEQARLQAARDEGMERGTAKGQIALLCELLGLPQPDDLDGRSVEELHSFAADLRRRLAERS